MRCKRCGKEFELKHDFIEDVELLEALSFYFGGYLECYCDKCLYKIDTKIEKIVKEFKEGKNNERCGAVFSDLLLTKHNKDCAVTQSETASLKSDKLDEIIHKIDDAGVSTSVGYIKIKESNLRQVLKNYFTKQKYMQNKRRNK